VPLATMPWTIGMPQQHLGRFPWTVHTTCSANVLPRKRLGKGKRPCQGALKAVTLWGRRHRRPQTLVSDARLETCAMGLPALATHAVTATGLAAVAAIAIRHACDALLRLAAGITAILTRDKRSRADRALDVLRMLRHERRSGR
jgi:hypothetical protein